MTEILGKPERIRGYSHQGCGDNILRVRNHNLAEISINEKPKLFSWSSKDCGRNIFHLKSGANLGPKEERIGHRKRSHLLPRVGEAAENETEKLQGKIHIIKVSYTLLASMTDCLGLYLRAPGRAE